jgi:hypothetical protein
LLGCALCVPWLCWQIGCVVRPKWGESYDATLSSVDMGFLIRKSVDKRCLRCCRFEWGYLEYIVTIGACYRSRETSRQVVWAVLLWILGRSSMTYVVASLTGGYLHANPQPSTNSEDNLIFPLHSLRCCFNFEWHLNCFISIFNFSII